MNEKGLKKISRASLCLSALALGFVTLVVLPSLSWFDNGTSSPIDIDGNVHGSYFESGTGTIDDPFEIARPIQLYYLSWLQEMGYFNEYVTEIIGEEPNQTSVTHLKQYHFYLSKDINMYVDNENEEPFTYTLPPIGTNQYPFVGSFDGKGHKISNLVITNNNTTYTDDPYNATDSTKHGAGYEVLGMFGVLGTTNSDNTVNTSITNQSSGQLEMRQEDATFDPSVVYVTNFYLENPTIIASNATQSSDALIGVVAAYANAPINRVGIKGATFSVASGRTAVQDLIGTESSTVLSKYTTVGYATDGNHRDISSVVESIYTPKATHSLFSNKSAGDDWGGSLEFESILERIRKSRSVTPTGSVLKNAIPEYVNGQTVVRDSNNTILSSKVTSTGTTPISTTSSDVYYRQGDDIGAYYYKLMTDSASGSNGKKVYLEGLSDVTEGATNSNKTVHTIQITNQTETAYYISDNGQYLGIDSDGQFASFQNKSQAIKWHFDSSTNSLSTLQSINGSYELLYLNANASGFQVGATNSTTWSYQNGVFTAGQGVVTLLINNASGWNNNAGKMDSTATWYVDRNTLPAENYKAEIELKSSSDSHGSQTLMSNSTTATYTLVITTGNQEVQYKPVDQTSTRSQLGINSTNWKAAVYSNSLPISQNTTKVEIRYTGNGYRMLVNSVIFTPLNATSIDVNSETTTDTKFTQSTSIERGGQAGYVPLSVVGTRNDFLSNGTPSIDKYTVDNANTGYIVGGFYDSNNGGDGNAAQYSGDVRVAGYQISKINTSYSTSTKKISNIQTYNESGSHTITTDEYATKYKKISQAIDNLEDTLDGSSWVYGVHFMDAAISMDHLVTAPKAVVNGQTFYNYDLPEDSIDFSLKSRGYINFFAGEYQSATNAFFSLHQIFRDDPTDTGKITDIKEIQYIYEINNNNSSTTDYIYKYKGSGGYSTTGTFTESGTTLTRTVNGVSTVYKRIFDTNWIGNNGAVTKGGSRLWYFEVPVNAGEFALGSVSGACGGYLVYLDISAAAQTVERKEINEYFIKDTIDADIANGTQYVSNISTPLDNSENKLLDVRDTSTINDLDSYVASIGTSSSGTYNIDRTSDNITLTDGGSPHTSGITNGYLGDGLTLNGSPINQSTRTVIRRITDYDHNSLTNLYTKQVTTIESSNNVNNATTTIYLTNDSYSSPSEIVTYSYSWNGDSPIFAYKYFLTMNTDGNSIQLSFDSDEEIIITVNSLNSTFKISVKNVNGSIDGSTFNSNNPQTVTVPIQTLPYTKDTWTSFSGNSIASYKYISQYDESVVEDFVYSFTSLGSITNPTATPQTISIENGAYDYEFSVSSTDSPDTDLYIYNTNGTIYKHFQKDNNGNWVEVA